ncbi:Bug family tripartite tricarboxylate transporter substrate binding protein [Pollutimonas harenae]|uniref:Tripartite tricarboxylate transporter substrate binding protein n=1 Tax=Pollutimonas harenae TaxID=657015 RepID=A0A853H2I0_9BURK|nr:tripartite tricarboxylate transporter substrate-binding protein [Pollutimonas harenae]NYT84783.1 tripartite tricarboxylate transporter substrate binding protein [Pollutimonas harenae]TEA72818.1 tripartite tricarboxylate transporter substrate binding protein [Pollutimonas harenae]
MLDGTRRKILCGLGALALTCSAAAQAASFPERPIRLIVPYSAGGGTDTIARHLSDRLTKHFKQSVIVENQPGANGIIGTRTVATAKPDGYTYVLVVNSHLINPLVQKDIPYDTFKDFVGVTMVARSPLAFLVNSDLPAKSMKEFVTLAHQPESKFAYGSSENMTRLVGNMLDYYNKLGMVSVSYKGGAPLMADVAAGVTTIGTTSILSANAYVQSGKVRPLAITGTERTSAWPDVPTLHELGMNEFDDVYTSYSLYAPAGTPKEILDTVQQAVHAVVFDPEMKKALANQAAEPVADSVDDFNQQVKKDFEFWKSLADAINLKPI